MTIRVDKKMYDKGMEEAEKNVSSFLPKKNMEAEAEEYKNNSKREKNNMIGVKDRKKEY